MINTIQKIRESQPQEKLQTDTLVAKIFYRPISYYMAAVLWDYFQIPPNVVSFLSAACAVSALLWAWLVPGIAGVTGLLLLCGILDCSDGALARYLGTSGAKGELADAIGGYVILAVVPYVAWLMAFPAELRWDGEGLVLGFLTSIGVTLHLLGRSAHLKKSASERGGRGNNNDHSPSKMHRINGELSFCGFMIPILFVSWAIGEPLAAWLYVTLYSVGLGVSAFVAAAASALRG